MKSLAKLATLLFLLAWGCNGDTISTGKTTHRNQLKRNDALVVVRTPPFRNFFPCLDRIGAKKKSNRTATLLGADWELKVALELKCLPERDVVFFTRIENPLFPKPMITRTRLWITKKNDQIYAR